MKIRIMALIILTGLLCNGARASVLFTDGFEGGDWSKWDGHPNATVTDDQNRDVSTTGDAMHNAPAEVTFSAYEGVKSGKQWQLYWWEGFVGEPLTSSTFVTWDGTAMPSLQGREVTLDLQAFVSSYDSLTNGNSYANMFIKFFNADYSYYYETESVFKLISATNEDVWVSHQLTVTVPIDAEVMQVGIENNQVNWGGGAVYIDDVVISAVDNDTVPPSPDPMSFAVAPFALSDSAISMTATNATDNLTAVEYYFTCTNNSAFDSGWQSDTNYVASGLAASNEYFFTVTARDTSDLQTATEPSPAESAWTFGPDTDPPEPNPMTFEAIEASPISIKLTASEADDVSAVQYYFACIAGTNNGGTDSGWQSDRIYIDDGLVPGSNYTYTVTARDLSATTNTTGSSEVMVTTAELPRSASLSNTLQGFTGDSTQAATRHDLAMAGFEIAADSAEKITSFDGSGAAFGDTPTWGSRNILRTLGQDYGDYSFEFSATFITSNTTEQAAFVGVGQGLIGQWGVPDFEMDGVNAINAEMQSSFCKVYTWVDGGYDVPVTQTVGITTVTNRVRMIHDATNETITVELDIDYAGGAFNADRTLGLHSTTNVWEDMPQRIYIAAGAGVLYKDIEIVSDAPPITFDLGIEGPIAGVGTVLTWEGYRGQIYEVQYATSLSTMNWDADTTVGDLGEVVDLGGMMSVTSTVNEAEVFDQVFYRFMIK